MSANAPRGEPGALHDAVWLARYGAKAATCWFAFTDAYTVAWFKARHRLDAVLTFDARGLAFATWRGDTKRPNVRRVGDDGWVDDGALAHGTTSAGDVLEAYCLTFGKARATVLRDTAHDILATARHELEAAARARGPLPAWLYDIVTPAGWRHYDELVPECPGMSRYDGPGPNEGQIAHVWRLLDEDNNPGYARRYMIRLYDMAAWPVALVAQLEALERLQSGGGDGVVATAGVEATPPTSVLV